MSASGVFITLEGGEGSGKSTQVPRLAASLRATGREVVTTREPGGTPGAEAIRRLMLDPATDLAPLADAMLVFAARADHVDRLIRPALARGAIVLCDRYTDSTVAYQGHGLGVDRAAIATLRRLLGLEPDLTLILDLAEAEAAARLQGRGGDADRYERLDAVFAARVRAGFREIAAAEPQRCALIDGSGEVEAVTARLHAAFAARLPELGLPEPGLPESGLP